MNNNRRTEFINEFVYQSLRADIISLQYAPGTKLSENGIAAKYQVSRAPIRLVFQRLAAEQFVQIEPQRGTFVTKLDFNYILNIIYMRLCVETDMLQKIAREKDYNLIERIEENLTRQYELIQIAPENLQEFNQLDNQFHQICYYAQHKGPLWNIIEQSSAHYTRYRMLDLVAEHSCQKTYEEHRRIYSYIVSQQMDELKHSIYDHLYGNLQKFEGVIKDKYQSYFLPLQHHTIYKRDSQI